MFSHYTIRVRMLLVFGMLAGTFMSIGAAGVWQIRALRAELAAVPDVVKARLSLADWQGQTAINARRAEIILGSSDTGLAERLAGPLRETSARINALQKDVEALAMSDAARQRFQEVGETRRAYVGIRDRVLQLKRTDDAAAARAFTADFVPALRAYEVAVSQFTAQFGRDVDDSRDRAQQATTRILTVLGAASLLALALAAFAIVQLSRSITGPLAIAVALAKQVADGDLTGRIEVRGRDEVSELLAALRRMNDGLQKIVGTVRDGTEAIASASQEIATGNADLSSRTEQQASSLEETASSMEELTSTVKQNADSARQANQLAASASAVAVKGGEVVGQVVGTMTSINESSKKIVDIIAVIDGIAFQTNILALNAAVEAARAGEQGRGFAVVASEVRSLAQRSAAAAKEIKQLITDSVGKVADGTRLVDEAGRTMGDIVASVQRVTDIMAEISAASQEQSSGIEQVNQAVTQMDEATQQNAALVEQAAAAAESLQEQAARLTEAIGIFRISHLAVANEDAPARPPRPASDGKVAALPVRPVVRERKPAAPASGRRSAAAGTDDVWEEF